MNILKKIFTIGLYIFIPFTADAYNQSSCAGAGDKALCVALGFGPGSGPWGGIYTSDGGKTWLNNVAEFSWRSYTFTDVSCNKSLIAPTCIIVGKYEGGDHIPYSQTLALIKIQNENRWKDFSYTDWQHYENVSCIKDDKIQCYAGGSYGNGHGLFDTRPNWRPSPYKIQSGLSCIGSGEKSFCLGAMIDAPIILKSTDLGHTWARKNISHFPDTIISFSIIKTTCTDATSNGFCLALGKDNNSDNPFLVQSTDGGDTWTYKSINDLLPNGSLNDIGCAKDKNVEICIAVGSKRGQNELPFIMGTTDKGIKWKERVIVDEPNRQGILNAVNCSFLIDGITCTAGGKYKEFTKYPLFIQSVDNGNKWTQQQIEGALPTQFQVNSISCTEENDLCIVAGETIVVSKDYRKSWKIFNP